MSNAASRPVIGFDLGHGETALARTTAEATDAPQVMQIHGSNLSSGRQCITAVNEQPDGTVIIGDNAIDRRTGRLYLAFKGAQLTEEQVRHPTQLFSKQVRDSLYAEGDLRKQDTVSWVFGCPSGWPPPLRAQYADLFREAGFSQAEVVTESRAAMLYARDSGEVKVDTVALNGCVLVVDLGSSTVDFTAVVRRRQQALRGKSGQRLELRDRGTNLGASLIEQEIMERTVREHPQRDLLDEMLAGNQNARLKLEVTCRKAKEDYFRLDNAQQAAGGEGKRSEAFEVPGKGRIWVNVLVTREDMESVLDTPLPRLGGRSWRQAFREDLRDATAELKQTPDIVLLTGGASRMGFVLEVARETFGKDKVLRGAEPEAAIARGLAIAGRIGARTTGFIAEVQRLLRSGQVRELVEERLPDLAARVGTAATDGFTERHVIPAFRRWRNGDIRTLNAMADEISRGFSDELGNPANKAIMTAVAEWQDSLRPQLEELTRPICNKWHLSATALTLPPADVSQQGWNIAPVDRSAAATDFMTGLSGVIAGVVAGILSAVILAHLLLGPIGLVLGAVTGVYFFAVGKDKAKEKIMDMELPRAARRMQSEATVLTKLRAGAGRQDAELGQTLAGQIVQKSGSKVTVEISMALERELETLADEAKFMIE